MTIVINKRRLLRSSRPSAQAAWSPVSSGTLECAGSPPPRAFELAAGQANGDPTRVGSALWQPLKVAWLRLRQGIGSKRPQVGPAAWFVGVLSAWPRPVEAASEAPAGAREPAGALEQAPAPPAQPAPESAGAPESTPAPPAASEDVRTVVVGSMFEGDELPRVAGSAHVVGQRELERREYDDVHRVLQGVPGVYVRGEDGFGLRPNIGMRGANPDRSAKITLMEDGLLMAPAPYSAPAAYYFPLTTRMVGLEVFKGPAAILHGPNTIGGAVNLRTRPIPMAHDATVDVATGRFGYLKGHGFYGTTHRGFGVLVEAARIQSDGFKQLDGGGDTGFGKNDAMLKLGYEARTGPTTVHRLVLKSGFATERSNETYLGLSRGDFERTPYRRYAASALDKMTWWRSQFELGYSVGDPTLEVQTHLYRHDFHRVWRRLDRFRQGPPLTSILANPGSGQLAVLSAVLRGEEDARGPEQALLVTRNDRRFVSQGIQSVLHWRPSFGVVSQDLQVGVRLHYDSIVRNHLEDGYLMTAGVMVPEGGPTVPAVRNRARTYAVAMHVHDAIKLWDRLTIAPGIRVENLVMDFADRNAGSGARRHDVAVTPGLGVLFDALPWLGVFAGVHRGFSPVTPGQGAAVKPEYSVNYEAGVRAIRRRVWAEAVGFFSDYSNLNGACTFSSGCVEGDGSQQFSGGRVFVYGLESLVRYRQVFRRGFSLELGARYTFTGSQFRQDFQSGFPQWGAVKAGDELPYLPKHVVGGTVAVGGRRWEISAAPNFNGAMRDEAGQGPIPAAKRIDGYFVLDASAEVRVAEPLRLYTQVGNVTGNGYAASYRPFGLRPGPPLTVMIGAKLDLFRPGGSGG